MTATATTIELPYLPASLNQTLYTHWTAQRKAKQRLQNDLGMLLRAARMKPADRLKITLQFVFPDKRRRDLDNYSALLRKSLGDALVMVGLIPDDTPEHLSYGLESCVIEKGIRAVRIGLFA